MRGAIQFFRNIDGVLLLAVCVLFGFGISAIYSVELSRDAGYLFVQKQLIAFGIGMVLLFIFSRLRPAQLRNYARGMYLAGVILLLAVLVFGSTVRGTTGWFVLGPISFQPVEFMKIALIVQLSRYFSDHARRRFGWREIWQSGLLTFVPVALVIMQPDLGSASLLLGLWACMLIFAGIRWYHIAILGGISLVMVVIAWLFLLAPYQKTRIEVFLNPQADALGSGYNVSQAQIAIGSGRWTGSGLGFGSQSQLKFLPESQTDFVFAVIAEELGFIGVCVLFAAFILLFYRLIAISRDSEQNYAAFLVAGIASTIFVQMSVNIGVNLAILPATGVALPLVSYGGSSMVFTLLLLGFAEGAHMYERQKEAGTLGVIY